MKRLLLLFLMIPLLLTMSSCDNPFIKDILGLKSEDANLSSLTVSDGTQFVSFNIPFNKDNITYTATVGTSINSVTVTAQTSDPNATIQIAGVFVNSGTPYPVTLSSGSQMISITVTAEKGNTKVYTITVTKGGGGGSSAPATPTGLSASSITSSSYTITWTASTGATGYYVYKSTTSGGAGTKTTATGTSWPESGLASNYGFYYKVSAYNANGESAPSAELLAKTAPETPTGLRVTGTTSSTVSLAWYAPSSGADGYYVYKSLSSGGTFSQTGTIADGSTSWTEYGLASNTPFYFKVRAYNSSGAGVSAQTPELAATTQTSTVQVPSAPTGLTATAVSATSITLSWTKPSLALGYNIYRASVSGGTGTIVGTINDGNITSWTNTPLASSTSYWYKVSAFNGSGEGDLSPELQVTTQAPAGTPPGIPQGLYYNATTTSITVYWSPVSGADGYKIFRSDTGATGTYNYLTSIGAVTNWVNDNLSPDTVYYYKVSAHNTAGEGPQSSYLYTKTFAQAQPPAPPASVWLVDETETTAILSWILSAGATEYRIYMSSFGPNSGFSWFDTISESQFVAQSYSWQGQGLSPATTYWFRITAYNAVGESPYWSDYVVAATESVAQPPLSPANLHATSVSDKTVILDWDDVVGATFYKVYRSLDGDSYSPLTPGGWPYSNYPDEGLNGTTMYYYQVEAWNGIGASDPSTLVITTTSPPAQPPAAPQGLSVSGVSSSVITIEWAPVADAWGYRVYRSSAQAGPYSQIGSDTGAVWYQDSGLPANATFWYKVMAYNGAGDGNWSAELSVTTLQTGGVIVGIY